MKNKKIQYTADNQLHKVFLGLMVIWIIFGGILLFFLMTNSSDEYTIKEKIMFAMYYPFIELLFIAVYFLLKYKRKKFVEYRVQMISAGIKASGKICRVRREYARPNRENESKRIASFYYAEIEYFDDFQNAYVRNWTTELREIPYGEKNYREEMSNRYETIYVPKSSLLCTVYYLKTGEFFVE